MSIPGAASPLFIGAAAAEEAAFQIDRSLRFSSDDSAYLSRTPSSAGNRKTWTWSGWVKRSSDTYPNIFTVDGSTAGNFFQFVFEISGAIHVRTANNTNALKTERVFRDFSAWYHLVLAVDTTQATSSNRIKLYVNGSQVTDFSIESYPAQNADLNVNTTNAHYIGRAKYDSFPFIYSDGYLAEVYFVDGQALAATDFGEYDDNNVWQPKEYSGTYGTNGFYLKFDDNSSNAALGNDSSGNDNDWTVNNLSVASGAGNDSLIDTPSNYTAASGNNGGNYCTLNPLSNGVGTAPKNGNLDLAAVATAVSTRCNSTIAVSSGKWYFETTLVTGATGSSPRTVVGIAQHFYSDKYVGEDADSYGFTLDQGYKYNNGTGTSYATALSNGDVFMCAFDLDNNKIFFGSNGTWFDSSDPAAGTSPAYTINSGTYCPSVRPSKTATNTPEVAFNFGARSFAYTPPTGYSSLCSTNLPDPTIADGSTAFDAVTYTGNGGTKTISGLSFSPDFVWCKARGAAHSHVVFDTVRGTLQRLLPNSTNAESEDVSGLSAFNADGFTAKAGNELNAGGTSYVAWTWDAGSSTVSNTDGSITSNVRASQKNGFSIVTHTGNGTNPSSIGHGLNSAPVFYITKSRDSSTDWVVSTTVADGTHDFLDLNNTQAIGAFDAGLPTSSVFYVSGSTTNKSGDDYVTYCWTPVAGYSAFGKYEGNGNANGPFVYTGMRPKWILLKNADQGAEGYDWVLYDTERDTYNVGYQFLCPNAATKELRRGGDTADQTNRYIDILSNGFKIRNSNANYNRNGDTFIYAAFAEHPFATARAR